MEITKITVSLIKDKARLKGDVYKRQDNTQIYFYEGVFQNEKRRENEQGKRTGTGKY